MFSTTCEYALRALNHLASSVGDDHVVLGRELSSQAAVPHTYLSKIMLDLRDAGLVTATRGTGGGYELARAPHSITLMEVVELFDGPVAQPQCILGLGDCSDHRPNASHKAWKELRRNYIEFLQLTTVFDMVPSARAKRAGKSGSI